MELNANFVSRCRFGTDRLHIKNWDENLNNETARGKLLLELAALLTPTVTRFLPEPLQLPAGAQALDEWIASRRRESDVFCVRDRHTGAFLGLMILGSSEAENRMTIRIGYLLTEANWGQGIATELIGGLVHWSKQQTVRILLLGGVETDNSASGSALIKAGFEKAADLSTQDTVTYQLSVSGQGPLTDAD